MLLRTSYNRYAIYRRAYITIIFTGLAIARYAEIVTEKSLRRINDLLEKVKEVLLKKPISEEVFSKYTQADNPEGQALIKLAKINWVT